MVDSYINTESIWFRVISLIVVGLFLALFIWNAVYWARVSRLIENRVFRTGATLGVVRTTTPVEETITEGEVNTLFWLNVIWAIIAAIFFIWALIRLFFHAEARAEATTKVKHYVVAKAGSAKAAATRQVTRTDIGFGRPEAEIPDTSIDSQPQISNPTFVSESGGRYPQPKVRVRSEHYGNSQPTSGVNQNIPTYSQGGQVIRHTTVAPTTTAAPVRQSRTAMVPAGINIYEQ